MNGDEDGNRNEADVNNSLVILLLMKLVVILMIMNIIHILNLKLNQWIFLTTL